MGSEFIIIINIMKTLKWFLIFLCVISTAYALDGCDEPGDVRLEEFIGSYVGRVEVCLNGVWGTICPDSEGMPWSLKNAQVVCRQLGYSGALNSILQDTIPASDQASSDTPIHYRNASCNGTESKLTDCDLGDSTAEGDECTHRDDVAIVCKRTDEEADVRLIGDTENGKGAVEIYVRFGSQWLSICPDSSVWNDVMANAACVQLGFESGTAETYSVLSGIQERLVDDFDCPSDTLSLSNCAFDTSFTPGTSSCGASANMYAGVNCVSSEDPEGSIRLFGADSSTEGWVEVLYDGRWGRVCDNQWSRNDGEVACRQLGAMNISVDVNPDDRNYGGRSEEKPICAVAGKGHPLHTSILHTSIAVLPFYTHFHCTLPFYTHFHCRISILHTLPLPYFHSTMILYCACAIQYISGARAMWKTLYITVLGLLATVSVNTALPPLQQLQQLSRNELVRVYFGAGFSYELIRCFLAALNGIVISLSTLKRILRKLNLRRRARPYNLRHAGNCLLGELNECGSLLGYRAMHVKLQRKYGVSIPREIVRGMLAAVDPKGVELRKKHRLVRRNYTAKGPNYSWHIDGNDKLKTYGFSIHGCIDGFSRRVIWLELATSNKESAVIAGYYLKAIERYGCPRVIRGDRGTENSRIAYLQPFMRRHGQDGQAGERSFQYGRSVSNQRIEGWWCTLRKWCTDWWIEFFKTLKDHGYFDETNRIHMDCIRFAFMDIIKRDLNDAVRMWNTHVIRKSGWGCIDGTPEELFYLPHLRGFVDGRCPIDRGDLNFCKQYSLPTPPHVPAEFVDLVEILMDENNLFMPENCCEALELYMDLINLIE